MSQYPNSAYDPHTAPTHRTSILRAATDLFGEFGYDGVSLRDIARRTDTSKTAVLYHFGSKQVLYIEVMREACACLDRVISNDDSNERSLHARVNALLRQYFQMMHSRPNCARLIVRQLREHRTSSAQALVTEAFVGHCTRIYSLFDKARERGEIAVDVPPMLPALMLVELTTMSFEARHLLRRFSGTEFVDDPDQYASLVTRMLSNGLRGGSSGLDK